MLTKIRLELARDHDHPEGSAAIGYEFAAPLDGNAKIDPEEWHKRRENCRVVRIDPQKDPSLRGSVAGADMAEALARHGVKAEAQGYPTDGLDEGQALMRCAEDAGAGLIVMGAYGHSRLAEFIFGGATRFVLTRLARPVLMSH